jgi:hypothetical protein
MMNWLADREHRKYLYGISIVAMPLLVAYGAVSETMAPLWVAVLGAILTPALALNNLTPPEDKTGTGKFIDQPNEETPDEK